MPNKKIIWFHKLTALQQEKVEQKLVNIITDKTTKLHYGGTSDNSHNNLIWIENAKEIGIVIDNITGNYSAPKYPQFDKRIFLFYRIALPRSAGWHVSIRFKSLPRKVELLLGIVYRPLFELYKEYLKRE